MLDRHAVHELVRARVSAREIAKQFGVSVRAVRRIIREGVVETSDDAVARSARHLGRPRVTDAIRARVHSLVLEDPDRPPGEIGRLLKEEGTQLGLSTVYRVLASVRATIPTALQVRFEGVAGEFAQFDFGEASVRLTDGSRRTAHFAAYRLKYSRWMRVVLVPNERVEALIRSLLDSFAASDGVPLRVVFDNPKTVVVRHEDGRPVWNAVLGPVAIDYGFTIELCTPRQPQQKGAVENLVGFVKRAFFRARRFTDLTTDLPQRTPRKSSSSAASPNTRNAATSTRRGNAGRKTPTTKSAMIVPATHDTATRRTDFQATPVDGKRNALRRSMRR